MADSFLRTGGRDVNGQAKPIKVTAAGEVITEVKPKNVKEIIAFDATEIRDTVLVSSRVDLSEFKKVRWKAYSTLNEPPTLYFATERKYNSNSFHIPLIFNGTDWVEDARSLTLSRANRVYDVTSQLDWLDWSKRMEVAVRCPTAPTSGSITIIAEGAVN